MTVVQMLDMEKDDEETKSRQEQENRWNCSECQSEACSQEEHSKCKLTARGEIVRSKGVGRKPQRSRGKKHRRSEGDELRRLVLRVREGLERKLARITSEFVL